MFKADEHDRGEMTSIFLEDLAHGDDPPAGVAVTAKIRSKAQRTPQTFILDEPLRFEQRI